MRYCVCLTINKKQGNEHYLVQLNISKPFTIDMHALISLNPPSVCTVRVFLLCCHRQPGILWVRKIMNLSSKSLDFWCFLFVMDLLDCVDDLAVIGKTIPKCGLNLTIMMLWGGREGRPPAVAPITSQADSASAKLKSQTRPGLLTASLKQLNYERSWSVGKSTTPLWNQQILLFSFFWFGEAFIKKKV